MTTLLPVRAGRRLLSALVLLLVCVPLSACRKPLLSSDEERSQFQRYDQVRELDQPSYYMDEFGRRRPNLRGRLGPEN